MSAPSLAQLEFIASLAHQARHAVDLTRNRTKADPSAQSSCARHQACMYGCKKA